MLRNNGDMIIYSSTYISFESSATVEPRQRISNIYINLNVSDQSVFIGSELVTIAPNLRGIDQGLMTLYFSVPWYN